MDLRQRAFWLPLCWPQLIPAETASHSKRRRACACVLGRCLIDHSGTSAKRKFGFVDPGWRTLSNEDLYNLKQFTLQLGGQNLLYTSMGGGEITTRLGLMPGSNIGALGSDTAILVVACDLEQEAPSGGCASNRQRNVAQKLLY